MAAIYERYSGIAQILKFKAELTCPRCSSSNIDKRYMHMGELSCKHCHYFWRVE